LWAERSGVRVLQINWVLDARDVNSANPRDDYMLTVIDAAGTQTGALSDTVLYAHSRGCCDDRDIWTGQLSD